MQVTTSSGFTCEVKDNAFNDYRVVKLIAKLETKDANEQLAAIVSLIERVLPDGQEEALISHLEGTAPDGIATVEAMSQELTDIMAKVTASKKK